jgi:hypothetical protein
MNATEPPDERPMAATVEGLTLRRHAAEESGWGYMVFRATRKLKRVFFFVAVLAAGGTALADPSPVRVLIPAGLNAGFSEASPSKVPGMKYVSVEDVRLFNPSGYMAQSFKPSDFHLLAGDSVFQPVVRPGYKAVDLSEPSVLAPHQGLVQTVTFLVPDAVTTAKFEFVPHWFDDAGGMVDFCGFYLGS